MWKKYLQSIALCTGLGFAALGASGCGSVAIDVVRYPDFWSSDRTFDTIAVGPVENSWERGKFEGAVADRVVSDLVENGSYRVYDHTRDFSGVFPYEAELAVYGKITNYNHENTTETRYRTEENVIYKLDKHGHPLRDEEGRPIVDHIEYVQVPYPWFNADAYSTMNVQVYTVADGAVVYSKNVSGHCHDDGPSPRSLTPPPALMRCAVLDMADTAADKIAPNWKRVYADIDDLLQVRHQTAKGWEFDTTFSWGDPELKIRLVFPDAARMNKFSFDIIPADIPEPFHQEEFVWESEYSAVEYTYPIADFANADVAGGKFQLRLWNRGKVIAVRDFKIK